MGRPKAKFDWKKIDNFLKAGCTGTEVAAFFGVHPETLYGACETKFNMRFSEYSQEKKASGDSLLRATQFKMALDGDKSMLIFLGKQRLGQRDKWEIITAESSLADLLS